MVGFAPNDGSQSLFQSTHTRIRGLAQPEMHCWLTSRLRSIVVGAFGASAAACCSDIRNPSGSAWHIVKSRKEPCSWATPPDTCDSRRCSWKSKVALETNTSLFKNAGQPFMPETPCLMSTCTTNPNRQVSLSLSLFLWVNSPVTSQSSLLGQ